MSDATPKPPAPTYAQLEELVSKLTAQVQLLTAKVAELEAKLKRNSTNSSQPPSADPPWFQRPPKPPTGRKPGGQPGHPGHFRQRLEPTRVHVYVPTQCAGCGHALPAAAGPRDPAPVCQQVLELPRQPLDIIEHQSHARTCPHCRRVTRQPLPPDVKGRSVGPRLSAALALLVAKGHVARRFVVEWLRTVYGVPLSLGTVSACEAEVSAALAQPYDALQEAVRHAPGAHMDETGWRCFQKQTWLWVVSTARAVFYAVRPTRSSKELQALLGDLFVPRIVHSDRFGVYNGLPLEYRQLCWAHLIRDFARMVELEGGAEVLGQRGLDLAAAIFDCWYRFRDGHIGRVELRVQIQPLRAQLEAALLEAQRNSPSSKARNFAGRIVRQYRALWTFVEREGVEPTNNEAERMLRTLVQWRKNSYGCHSLEGCQFAERIMSVIQTLRKQSRDLLAYLTEALQAHRAGLAAPSILTSG